MSLRELYGFGFKIDSKGNPVINGNGTFEMVEGKENFGQRIDILFGTQYGEDIFHPEYGFDKDSILGNKYQIDFNKLFELNIVKTANREQDDQILDIKQILIYDIDNYPFVYNNPSNLNSRQLKRLKIGIITLQTVYDEIIPMVTEVMR